MLECWLMFEYTNIRLFVPPLIYTVTNAISLAISTLDWMDISPTVSSMLFPIRSGICGSCAMNINGNSTLACIW